ncbi:IS701 family transposase [Kitasatospora sp. NPDC091207]|uniref:IS701 family transposase n=1 Tax=Kitasatospora sp. NPDC091207 TaxID=3364083 RepID=UPI0037FA2183
MRHLHQSVGTTEESAPATALDPELSARLFGSLRRSGQRLKAEQYVRGLLALEGRKTLRGIAAQFDGVAAQQSVHHFISASPWEWMPVRHALAHQVQRTLAPQAWVVRPILIPKAGSHSVGIDQQVLPLGRIVNGQHAVGVWLASGHSAVPVDWQLRLSARWLADPLRERASVPADAAVATIEDCVRTAVANVQEIGVLRGPVVVDVAEVDAVSVARFLASMGVAFVVRVGPQAQLWLDRTELPSYSGRERTAGELAESLPRLRRQVNPGDGPTTAVAIPVVTSLSRGERMLLLGEWRPVGRPRRRLWLTNADAPSVLTALRLTRLPGVVLRDFTAISERVGVRDFGGRSFPGWHRHITLASVAHLIATLESRGPVTRGGRTGG